MANNNNSKQYRNNNNNNNNQIIYPVNTIMTNKSSKNRINKLHQ